MFYLDIRNGKAYFRGDIHAENGYFRGEVHATSGEFTGTLKAATLDGKLVGTKNGTVDLSDVDYIDLGGMILDGRPGSTGITFRPGYEPVKYQFATSSAGPWHDTMEANDKYRRDSLDGGTTWGTPYQFRGTDGKNGANGVVDYTKVSQILKETYGITETYVTSGSIGSPVIQGAEIYGCKIFAGGGGGQIIGLTNGGISIYNGGSDNPTESNRVLTISGNVNGAHLTTGYNLLSVSAPDMHLGITHTLSFAGMLVDFSNVKEIRGVHATWVD